MQKQAEARRRPIRGGCCWRVLLWAAIGVGALPARAQESHIHVPLTVDPGVGWALLIDSALAAYPGARELEARAAEVGAWHVRGEHWLAAAPALYLSYLSDAALDAVGQREYEGGVELPLWRGGQRDAVRTVASSAATGSTAAEAALWLEVAGLLRTVLWNIEAAANALEGAREAADVGRSLVQVVETRQARGDLARGDVLLARAVLLEREQRVVEAEAELLDAERAYRSLTGLDRRPVPLIEVPSPNDELTDAHPLLGLANATIERARADRELVAREARGNLMLTLGSRRQYDPFVTLPTDSLAVGVKVPFGGERYGTTQQAHAARLVAAAEAERGQLLRRLDLDVHEAEHTLSVLAQTSALATARRDLAGQQAQMAESAFAQGEIELLDLLRIQEAALAAQREVRRLTIEEHRTVAALNQALGDLP